MKMEADEKETRFRASWESSEVLRPREATAAAVRRVFFTPPPVSAARLEWELKAEAWRLGRTKMARCSGRVEVQPDVGSTDPPVSPTAACAVSGTRGNS